MLPREIEPCHSPAALDDLRFCMDGMTATASTSASRASSAAEVATYLADPSCRRAVRTQRLWAPLLVRCAGISMMREVHPP